MTPQDEKFENDFIAGCTEMKINSTLPASGPSPAWAWASDGSYHVRSSFCGCENVKIFRAERDTYTRCSTHGFKSFGRASRIRRSWRFSTDRAGAR